MRLSWNEIRTLGARFTNEWKNIHYEKGEMWNFYNDSFQNFGVQLRLVVRYE